MLTWYCTHYQWQAALASTSLVSNFDCEQGGVEVWCLRSVQPNPIQVAAQLVIFPFNPSTHPTRKVVSSHNIVYLAKTKCYRLVSKLQKHI